MPLNSTKAIEHNTPWLLLFPTFWAFLLSVSVTSHFNPSPSHTEKNELTMSSPTRLAFFPLAKPHFLYFCCLPLVSCCLSKQLPIRFPEIYHGLSPKVRMLILQKRSWQLGRSCCQGGSRSSLPQETVWRQAQVWIMPGHPRLSKAGTGPMHPEVRFPLIMTCVPI